MTRHRQFPREARPDQNQPPDACSDGTPDRPNRANAALGLLAAVLLLPSLFYPLARDQGVFAYVGALILKGGWPYRDVWEVKPPGIYYTYAAIIGCSGRSMGGVRACDLIAAVATVLLLGVALRRVVAAEAARLAGLLYAALYLRLGFWGLAQAQSHAHLWTP